MNRHSAEEYSEYYYDSYSTNNEQYYYTKKPKKKNKPENQKFNKKYSSEYKMEEKKVNLILKINKLEGTHYTGNSNWKKISTHAYSELNANLNNKKSNSDKKYFIIKEIVDSVNKDFIHEEIKKINSNKQSFASSKSESISSCFTSATNSINENSNSYNSGEKIKDKLNKECEDPSKNEMNNLYSTTVKIDDDNKNYKMIDGFEIIARTNCEPDDKELQSLDLKSSLQIITTSDNKLNVVGKNNYKKTEGFKMDKCEGSSNNNPNYITDIGNKYLHSKSNEDIASNLQILNDQTQNKKIFSSNYKNIKLRNFDNDATKYSSNLTKISNTEFSKRNSLKITESSGLGLKLNSNIGNFKTKSSNDIVVPNDMDNNNQNYKRKISCPNQEYNTGHSNSTNSNNQNRKSNLSDSANNKTSNYDCVSGNAKSSQNLKQALHTSKQNYNKFNMSESTCNDSKAKNTSEFCKEYSKEIQANSLNTPILILKLKINKNEDPKTFSLGRFDDLKAKIQEFCENNGVDPKFENALEQKVLYALSKIYLTYNMSLDTNNVGYLNSLNMLWNDSTSRTRHNIRKKKEIYESNSEVFDSRERSSYFMNSSSPTSLSCIDMYSNYDDHEENDTSSLNAFEYLINRSF